MIGQGRGAVLLALARHAIAGRLGDPGFGEVESMAGWLDEPAATFVTLERDGKLRGCIGSLNAERSLGEDVAENACAAAFDDPRFPPLAADELEKISIEVSILSPAQPIRFISEDDLLARLRPGEDGVVLEYGKYRATFLPQVWDGLARPARFVAELKKKAGLDPDFWSEDMRFYRYTVEKFKEG